MKESLAFTMNQAKFGKGVCNIKIVGIELRHFASSVLPQGEEGDVNLKSLEEYGLSARFARILMYQEQFVLTEEVISPVFGRNLICGVSDGLELFPAKIIIGQLNVRFMAEALHHYSLREGFPVSNVDVPGVINPSSPRVLELFLRGNPVKLP